MLLCSDEYFKFMDVNIYIVIRKRSNLLSLIFHILKIKYSNRILKINIREHKRKELNKYWIDVRILCKDKIIRAK